MRTIKTRIVADGQRLAQEQITAYKSGKIRLKPGCDALQSLESEVNGLLGKVRENCGKEALGALSRRNAPLCMAQCGSKVTSCGGLTYLLMLRCGPCVMCEASKPSRPLTPHCLCACGGARWQGSPLNISQMIACLGQQSVGGQRIQDGFVGRTLPHFPVGALYPAAKGTALTPIRRLIYCRQVLFHVPLSM
jgi:DNA-directed RNA polymerase III subunit RPC1